MLQTQTLETFDLRNKAADRAQYVAGEFDRARDRDTAYFASHALHSLARHASARKFTIQPECAEMIRRSIEAASPHLLNLFPDTVDRSRASLALSKAKAVAATWARAAPHRASCEAASLRNEIRHVEWLRNCCHNLALLDEIEEFHARRAREARKARQVRNMPSQA